MNDDLKVTVTLTAEDLAFYDQAKAAGIPSMLVSMYSGALKRLVASAVEAEREACIELTDSRCQCAWVIKARGEK